MPSALVNYPGFGSVWPHDAQIEGEFVVGVVEEVVGSQGETAPTCVLNFPLSCVRKWADA